jgi:hypothetical protein
MYTSARQIEDKHTLPEGHSALQSATASGDQVDDQNDQRDHQQKVNQAAGYVKAEAQNPQDQKDDENCPEHIQHTFSALRAPETGGPARAHPMDSKQALISSKQSTAPLLA